LIKKDHLERDNPLAQVAVLNSLLHDQTRKTCSQCVPVATLSRMPAGVKFILPPRPRTVPTVVRFVERKDVFLARENMLPTVFAWHSQVLPVCLIEITDEK
jgi:hypothetical protein